MSRWTERLEAHNVNQQLKTLYDRITEAEPLAQKNSSALQELARIRQIREQIEFALNAADPVLVSINHLDSLQSQLSQIISEVTAYNSNNNTQHLVNANNYSDPMLVNIAVLSLPRNLSDLNGVREAVTSLRKSVAQHLKHMDDEHTILLRKFKDLLTRADELAADVKSQQVRVDASVHQMQQQFLEHEDNRRDQFDRAEKARDKEAANTRKHQADELTVVIERHTTAANQVVEQSREQFQLATDDLKGQAEAVMAHLSSLKTEAEELVGAIAMRGMAGGFQKIANREMGATRIWQAITVASMIGLVAVASTAIQMTTQPGFNWGAFGARVFVAISVGVLAAYAARQAEKHHDSERHNRRMELELSALDPYLAALPETDRHRVKTELVARLFAQPDHAKNGGDPKTNGNAVDVLKLVVELLQNK